MKRVLIIEDDPETRACVAFALSMAGHAVEEAKDGLEGLRVAGETRPDLILLDLMMPTMDGRQFRAAQQLDPELARIPVIVTSAVATLEYAGMEGVAAAFQKPFDLDLLLEAVDRSSPQRRGRAAAR